MPVKFIGFTTEGEQLRADRPQKRGVCIWLTGLSGSGKSTTAEALNKTLLEASFVVTLLDGDIVRKHLSTGLGFSKVDRDTNILRVGFVASEIVKHGGTVICATISPYSEIRNKVRNMVGKDSFIEVFVDTPLEICESRDVKGLYVKARRGEIANFTGINDPYETPMHPEIILDTVNCSLEENVRLIMDYLTYHGLVQFQR